MTATPKPDEHVRSRLSHASAASTTAFMHDSTSVHRVCGECWLLYEPDRLPVQARGEAAGVCCWCGASCRTGIFVRGALAKRRPRCAALQASPALKTYGVTLAIGRTDGPAQMRAVVAATSWREAAAAFGLKYNFARAHGSITSNAHEIAITTAHPGVVYVGPLNSPSAKPWADAAADGDVIAKAGYRHRPAIS